jgi:hypothetical protein
MNKRLFDSTFFRNFVAKNSRDKSGAGPHRSDKDYNRRNKEYENDALSYVQLTEQIELLKAQQKVEETPSSWVCLEKEINDLQDQLKEI